MLNERKVLNVYSLDHQGRGIAKVDNKIIFIPNTLPGEEVEVKITAEKKNFLLGESLKILKMSEERKIPICPHFYECGGCDLMHIDYEEELNYKETKVKDIIKKFASLNPEIIKPIIKNSDRYNYRNKVTFKIDKDLGFYSKNSNDIVKIDYCYIIDERINEIVRYINSHIDLTDVKQLIVRKSLTGDDLMVIFELKKETNIDKLKKLHAYATSVYIKLNNKYELIAGDKYIKENLTDLTFLISPDSFFQVNTKQAEVLYNKVKDYLNPNKNEVLLDLYSGTGTIGMFLSKYVKEVISVEINKYACRDAIENAKNNRINNIKFINDDAMKYLQKNDKKIDVLVVDPPRSGLEKQTVDKMLEMNLKKIVYVSCDPITLARDLNLLKEKYNIIEVTPVDMFPNTYHVECVVLLAAKHNKY